MFLCYILRTFYIYIHFICVLLTDSSFVFLLTFDL